MHAAINLHTSLRAAVQDPGQIRVLAGKPDNERSVASQDDALEVAALWPPSLLWTPPAWLSVAPKPCGTDTPCAAVISTAKRRESSTETSSISGTHADGGDSSGDEAGSAPPAARVPSDPPHPSETTSPPQRINTADQRSSSDGSSSGGEDDSPCQSGQLWQTPADVFGELDAAFTAASGLQSRRRALDLLKRGSGRPAAPEAKLALEAHFAAPAEGDNPVFVRASAQPSGEAH